MKHVDLRGIEVIPCIQTLGHLAQILQWHRYLNLRDTHEVLLAGSEETYVFIKKVRLVQLSGILTKSR